MSSTSLVFHKEQQWIRLGLFIGFILALLLTSVILIRYPGNAQTATRYLDLGVGTMAIEAVMGVWVTLWGTRPRNARARRVLRQGAWVGLLCGLLWVIEIGFNNFVSTEISTGTARFYVDNGFWAAIALIMLTTAAISTYHSRHILSGIQVSIWSGLVSGLIACLMASLLIVIWMSLLLRDPGMIQEFAERGSASGAPNMAAYVAYETLAGALGHLVVLGPVMGTLLGIVGGLIGKLLTLLRKQGGSLEA